MKPIKTYRLEIGIPEKAMIMLVGCGGTGSYTALHLAQLAHAARDQIEIKLVFIDPDRVEAKNVARQNFAPCEVGEFKAATLARRYSAAFGLPIVARPERFSAGLLYEFMFRPEHFNLIVGCVDNTAARLDIHQILMREMGHIKEFAGRNLWWLDAGNHHAHGQVCLGNHPGPAPLMSPLGFAFALPLPSHQNPDLITPEVEEAAPAEDTALSCADLVAMDVQSRTINKMMAAWIDVYCERLLISRDLRMMSTQIDQRSGTVYSTPITGGQVIGLATSTQEQGSYPAGYPAGAVVESEIFCPNCGDGLVYGYDVLDEAEGEVEIVFCVACGFRMRLEDFEAARGVPAAL